MTEDILIIADLIIPAGALLGGLIGLAVKRQSFPEPPGYRHVPSVVDPRGDRPHALDTRAAHPHAAPMSIASPATTTASGGRGLSPVAARVPLGQERHAVGTSGAPLAGVPTATSGPNHGLQHARAV